MISPTILTLLKSLSGQRVEDMIIYSTKATILTPDQGIDKSKKLQYNPLNRPFISLISRSKSKKVEKTQYIP